MEIVTEYLGNASLVRVSGEVDMSNASTVRDSLMELAKEKAQAFAKNSEVLGLARNAARDGIEGWVRLEVTVNPDGTVSQARVLESEPRRIFDRAARQAILRWKFRPRIVAGEPVAHRGVQTIEFRLAPP